MLHIRKSLMMRETLTSDMDRPANRPIVRAVAMAVIRNPFAGRYADDLTELFKAGRMLGEQFASDLVQLLSDAPVSYGKGAIVGLNGEHEHGGACIHPCWESRCAPLSAAAKPSFRPMSKLPPAVPVLTCR